MKVYKRLKKSIKSLKNIKQSSLFELSIKKQDS